MPQKTGEEKCVVCQEAITNPICPECLQREIEHWLADKEPTLISEFRAYTGIFKAYSHDGVGCVICGNNMNICAHCFCSDTYEFLSDNFDEGAAEDFLFSFNYELDREAG